MQSPLAFLYQVEGSGNAQVRQRVFYHIAESKIESGEERWQEQKGQHKGWMSPRSLLGNARSAALTTVLYRE